MQKCLVLLILTLLGSRPAFSQILYPAGDFRSPVDTTISLAGNFGEIRPNHFHAGFDIRTNNREGLSVYAIGEGYISRIKISPYGYGKALYITHPSGYTSVYAHLREFEGAIQPFTKKCQYAREQFELDTLLSADQLPVKKGALIGRSGNTGGSQGPHLHFEIRDAKTEMPLNPYHFGYFIPDTMKPRITRLAVYPLDDFSLVNGKQGVKKIQLSHNKGKYSYLRTDSITVHGNIGFGIECYDTENRSTNQNGVYSIELQSGRKRIYYYEMNSFSFENSRYVNAHIDYADKERNQTKIQKCFLSENNKAGIYKDVLERGRLHFTDDAYHWMKFIVKDFAGNTTELMLKVKSSSTRPELPVNDYAGQHFDCSAENKFERENIKLSLPADALYDDIIFNHYPLQLKYLPFGSGHLIHNPETALQKAMKLSIRQKNLPDSLRDKAVIISFKKEKDKMSRISYEGGKYENGWISTETKSFGNFAVTVDTLAPKLKPAFLLPKTGAAADLRKAKQIGVIAKDDLSGVKKYKATIDGKWVLCEYEYKKDLLFHTFEKELSSGEHVFRIEVTDDKGNTSVLIQEFKR